MVFQIAFNLYLRVAIEFDINFTSWTIPLIRISCSRWTVIRIGLHLTLWTIFGIGINFTR